MHGLSISSVWKLLDAIWNSAPSFTAIYWAWILGKSTTEHAESRGVASLTVPGWQESHFPQISIDYSFFFSSNFPNFHLHFGHPDRGRSWLHHWLRVPWTKASGLFQLKFILPVWKFYGRSSTGDLWISNGVASVRSP